MQITAAPLILRQAACEKKLFTDGKIYFPLYRLYLIEALQLRPNNQNKQNLTENCFCPSSTQKTYPQLCEQKLFTHWTTYSPLDLIEALHLRPNNKNKLPPKSFLTIVHSKSKQNNSPRGGVTLPCLPSTSYLVRARSKWRGKI